MSNNSSQIGNAERSAVLFYHRNKEPDYIKIIDENGKTIKQTIEEYIKSLKVRISLKDESLEITDNSQISAYIGRTTKADEAQKSYIRRICEPLGCTDSKHDGSDNRDTSRLETLDVKETIKVLSGKQLLETLGEDDLREVHKLGKIIKERCEFAADQKDIALVDHIEREEKVSTYKPVPGKSEVYYAIGEVLEQAEEFVQNLKGVLNKAFEYPPTNKEAEREDATKIRSLVMLLEPFNKFLRSCKDEKFSFSLWEHARGAVLRETLSKHGAAVKMEVPILDENGKPVIDTKTGRVKTRKMTRERMGDEEEEILQWMQDMSAAMKSYAFWMGFADWRDISSEMNGRIASRKDRLHGKLSDASIG